MAYIGNPPAPQNITSSEITDGTIVNVDIASDAAIAATKIAGLSTVATTGSYSDVTGTPTLATVATTGAYADVTGTPILATVATTGAYSDLTGTPTLPTDFVSAASGGTFSGAVVVTGEVVASSYNETYTAVTSASNATTVNCETGNSFSHTLTENTTFTFTNPPASGTSYTFSIEIIQDASASGFTVT